MAEQFQTSFIPKRVTETEPQERSFSGSGLTFFVGILAFVISLVLAGGVFAYDRYLVSSLDQKKQDLEEQRQAFAPEVIEKMSDLSKKLTVAEILLQKHVAVTGIFKLLQDLTLKTIRFKSFTFAMTDRGMQVSMQGEALSFTSIALQSDVFADNRSLSETVFSGFALDQFGNVTFNVTTIVDQNVISYVENMTDGGSADIQIEQPAGNQSSNMQQESNTVVQGDESAATDVSDLEDALSDLDTVDDGGEFDELIGG